MNFSINIVKCCLRTERERPAREGNEEMGRDRRGMKRWGGIGEDGKDGWKVEN